MNAIDIEANESMEVYLKTYGDYIISLPGGQERPNFVVPPKVVVKISRDDAEREAAKVRESGGSFRISPKGASEDASISTSNGSTMGQFANVDPAGLYRFSR